MRLNIARWKVIPWIMGTIWLCFLSSSLAIKPYQSRAFTQEGTFTPQIEGAAVDKNGNLYAVSFGQKETIGRVTPDGVSSLFVNMPKGSTANGIRFDRRDEMFVADYTGHKVLKITPEAKISVFADEPKMNQPNDLAIMDNDILFASDPNWKEGTGQLWRINKDGKTELLEKNMGTTNGIEVSPDQTKLYVNETKQLRVWVYDLNSKGEVSHKRLLHQFSDGGLDGMRSDIMGNLYITRWGKGEVVKMSPEGKILKTIPLIGQKPTNIDFGGQDGRTCFVTIADKGNIETFQVEHPGRSWKMRHRAKNAN